MDLATKQSIIDKIRACTRETFGCEVKFNSDEEFEKYKLMSIRCIESMNEDRLVYLLNTDTGEKELVEVDVNRYLQVFDPVIVDG